MSLLYYLFSFYIYKKSAKKKLGLAFIIQEKGTRFDPLSLRNSRSFRRCYF